MLELKNITKVYGKKAALQDVSVAFAPGQIVGLFGENGAGKTTLMKCILGLMGHKGEVTLDGEAIGCGNIARLSFATCEHSFFPRLSPKAHREFYREHFPRFNDKRFEALMDFFGLPMDKALRSYSVGMQNQFEVVLALSQGADYILMDEPFAGNDLFNREDFYKVLVGILEPQETLLLSTHLLEETAPFLSRALLLRQGTLVADLDPLALEETGADLLSYVKRAYHYQADRVSRALTQLTNGKEPLP